MEFNGKESRLKVVRGKRVMLRISNVASYKQIQTEAVNKFQAYHSNCFVEGEKYLLLLESGKEAQFLPGTKEFFTLKRFRKEVGKDYKNIVLYLCRNDDFDLSEYPQNSTSSEEDDDDNNQHPFKKLKATQLKMDEMLARKMQAEMSQESEGCSDDQVTGHNSSEADNTCMNQCPYNKFKATQLKMDEMLARKMQDDISQENEGCSDDQVTGHLVGGDGIGNGKSTLSSNHSHSATAQSGPESKSKTREEQFDSLSSLITSLREKIIKDKQFFFIARRGSTLQRYIKIWQREATKSSPENVLRVHFAGEDGIDTGAISKEFMTTVIEKVREEMFPYGAPADSMLLAHNGMFYTCGQMCAVSIAQGGPPPHLFEKCVYNMLVDTDLNTLNGKEHLTQNDKELLERIKENPVVLQDTIIEHGYTGHISVDNIDSIIGTVILSIINKRQLYLKEFKKGLECYGFNFALQNNANICEELFLINHSEVDANYLLTQLRPRFSEEGTAKRRVENTVFDNLHDFIISIEDESFTGYCEELAYADKDTEDLVDEDAKSQEKESSKVQSTNITPSGLLGWLTGQKHKPIDGQALHISVLFDHECLIRIPNHTICFPTVGACGKALTLPVAHLTTEEDFRKNMLLAFCKGQAFANA